MTNVWLALALTLFRGDVHRYRQCHRLPGQADQLPVPIHGHRLLGRGHALRLLCRDPRPGPERAGRGLRALLESLGQRWRVLRGHRAYRPHRQPDPSADNPHETHAAPRSRHSATPRPPCGFRAVSPTGPEGTHGIHDRGDQRPLRRTGLFTALAIAIHNFPEEPSHVPCGPADPTSASRSPWRSRCTTSPRGSASRCPSSTRPATRSAFPYSLPSGLAEPVGAVVAYLVLRLFLGSGAGHPAPTHGDALRRGRRNHGVHQRRRTPTHQPCVRQRTRQRPGP